MEKNRIFIAGLFAFSLTAAATGAWAVSQSRAAAQIDALLKQVHATCDDPDAPGCAGLLNQIEPGT